MERNESLTIGIDASRANEDEKTGVGWYAWYLIEELKKLTINNEQLTIVLYSREPLKGELADLPSNWQSKVLHWPPGRLWTQIRLSLEMFFHTPDILFVPAHVSPLIYSKKTIMTVHDIAATKFPDSYNCFERWYTVWSAKRALKNLWKVIVPSEFTKAELLKLTKNKEQRTKVEVIPLGFNKYKRTEGETKIKEILEKYKVEKPFLLSVGRLEEKKNTARIIEAFDKTSEQKIASNQQLVLVGKPGHGYGKVKQALERSLNRDKIKILGYMPNEDLACLMQEAKVFIFPSLYEGFGMPILEAMSLGVPVVAAKGSSMEEVGGDACIYVDPMLVESVAGGIEEVLANSEKLSAKSEKGLERVRAFSWEKCVRETLEVILS